METRFRTIILFSCIWVLFALPTTGQTSKPKEKALKVILFIDTECPISQSYMPELKKLAEQYQARNVQFESVFPVYTVTDKEIKSFLKKYNVAFPGSPDKDHKVANKYHAKVMPEVALVDANGMIVYQGAIDNWYTGLGKNRPKPTEFYLHDAIEATLNGNPVMTRRTEAVGCLINLD